MGEKTKQCRWCDAAFIPVLRNQLDCCPGHTHKFKRERRSSERRKAIEVRTPKKIYRKFTATDAAVFASLLHGGKSLSAIGRMFNTMGETVKATLRWEGYEV